MITKRPHANRYRPTFLFKEELPHPNACGSTLSQHYNVSAFSGRLLPHAEWTVLWMILIGGERLARQSVNIPLKPTTPKATDTLRRGVTSFIAPLKSRANPTRSLRFPRLHPPTKKCPGLSPKQGHLKLPFGPVRATEPALVGEYSVAAISYREEVRGPEPYDNRT